MVHYPADSVGRKVADNLIKVNLNVVLGSDFLI